MRGCLLILLSFPALIVAQPICLLCPENFYCPNSTSLPVQCPLHAWSLNGSTEFSHCKCNQGFILTDVNTCVPCPSIADTLVNGSKTECLCPPGYVYQDSGVCQKCLSQYCVNNQVYSFPAETNAPAEGGCNTTYNALLKVSEPASFQAETWFVFDVSDSPVRANAFEFEMFPGTYQEEYVEVCSTGSGCEVIHHCKSPSCAPFRKEGTKIKAFEERVVTSVTLFVGELVFDQPPPTNTLLSYALHKFTAPCVCSNRELFCPNVCDEQGHLQQHSFTSCKCVDGYLPEVYEVAPNWKSCVPCPPGLFCRDEQSLSCPARQQTYQIAANTATLCSCSPGYFAYVDNTTGQLDCELCPVDHYCYNGLALQCPDDYHTVGTGSSSASACIALAVEVHLSYIGPYSRVEILWNNEYGFLRAIASFVANDTALSDILVSSVVPMVDAKLDFRVSLVHNTEMFYVCNASTGSCSVTGAPNRTGCAEGLFVNTRPQWLWQGWAVQYSLEEAKKAGVVLGACQDVACQLSYLASNNLLVSSSGDFTTADVQKLLNSSLGDSVSVVTKKGSFTLRWFVDARDKYQWPTLEYKVASTGSISCSSSGASMRAFWRNANLQSGALNGQDLATADGNWTFSKTFATNVSIFLFMEFEFDGSCAANVQVGELTVSTREQFIPCIPLDLLNYDTASYLVHKPQQHSAKVVVKHVLFLQHGDVLPHCRECPQDFHCTGAYAIDQCPAYSGTLLAGAAEVTDCLCTAGYANTSADTCAACSLNTYKDVAYADEECSTCTENEVTLTEASTGEGDCVCVRGYTAAYNANGCVQCPINTYKDVVGNGACTVCPSFTGTVAPGSSDLTECVCQPGYTMEMGVCVPCESGTYKRDFSNSACAACPIGTYNPHEAANSPVFCSTCPVGTVAEAEQLMHLEQCEQCPVASYYQRVNNVSVCVSCPPYSISPQGSLHITQCECLPGFFRAANDTCAPCSPGSTKNATGDMPCTLCLPGTFEPRSGAVAASCVSCPIGTYQPMEGAANISDCIACPPDSYGTSSSATSVDTCLSCPENTSSLSGSYSDMQCVCKEGYYADDTGCVPCPTGFYKDVAGDILCTMCPHRTSTKNVGASSVGECVCSAGFYWNAQICADCPLGTFKDTVSNATSCTECGDHRTTLAKASKTLGACKCDVGTYESAYNPTNGSRQCLSCSDGYYQPLVNAQGATSCVPCYSHAKAGLYASSRDSCMCADTFVEIDAEVCRCAPGSFLQGSECALCEVGSYTEVFNVNASCTACKNFSLTQQPGANSSSMCVCDNGFAKDESNGICVCTEGAELLGGVCQKCGADKYKSWGMLACEQCPPNSITTETGATSIQDCKCLETFLRTDASECVCDLGQYISNDQCTFCPLNSYRDYLSPDAGLCQNCPANEITLSTGSKQAADCICTEGYERNEALQCTPCNNASYKELVGDGSCTACPLYSATSVQGATFHTQCQCIPPFIELETNCVCPPGMFLDAAAGICVICPVGTFQEIANTDILCLPCPGDSTTLHNGSTQNTDCKCLAGFEYEGPESATCLPCEIGKFNEAVGGACISCPALSTTNATGATSSSQCLCVPGSAPFPNASATDAVCTLCANGTYKTSTSNDTCSPCPPHSKTSGNDGHTFCVPDAGYYLAYGNLILECPKATYKESDGLFDCTPCSGLKTSPAASTSVENCTCPPGTVSDGVESCKLCTAGFYCPGGSEMLECEGGTSPSGSEKFEDCECNPGKYLYSQECILCPVDYFKTKIGNQECSKCGLESTGFAEFTSTCGLVGVRLAAYCNDPRLCDPFGTTPLTTTPVIGNETSNAVRGNTGLISLQSFFSIFLIWLYYFGRV